jgi:hypothetical protein
MAAVMTTGHKHKHPLEEGLEHINPIKALLVNIFGPADGAGQPPCRHTIRPGCPAEN